MVSDDGMVSISKTLPEPMMTSSMMQENKELEFRLLF